MSINGETVQVPITMKLFSYHMSVFWK